MFTVGMYAEAYTDKQEAVTVVAISTAEGARITVKEDDFTAIANYLHLNK